MGNEFWDRIRKLLKTWQGAFLATTSKLVDRWRGLDPKRQLQALAGGVAVGAILVLVATAGIGGTPAPKPLAAGGTGPEFIAYFENFGSANAPSSFPGLQAHANLIDSIMPLWFNVNGSGTVVNPQVDTSVDAYASSRRIRVEPMFTNLGDAMLTDPAARAAAVGNITGTVTRMGFAGADIDFELMPPSDMNDYNLFIQQLASSLHVAGKIISVTVFPKPGVSNDVAGVDDYSALAKYADYLVLMAYDNHSDSSGPGPVAPLPWVEAGVKYALGNMPPTKLVLAIGQYGYNWNTSTGVANYVSSVYALQLAKAQGVKVAWDSVNGENNFTYGSNMVWFQDSRSLALELALVRKYKLRGFALWRLGFEGADFWRQVKAFKSR